MKIISFFTKLWVGGLVFFLFITYIIPRERPFAQGKIYISHTLNNKQQLQDSYDILYYDTMNHCIKSLPIIHQWMMKNHYQTIVFYINPYESIMLYIHLKQQKIINNRSYSIGVMGNPINIKQIFFTYHQTIGIIWEYIIDYFVKKIY